jgi:mRNA-degrading endonuclease toxin of MazEF toxin-antitoxin module
VKRGEIWLVAGGVYASKPRPTLIVQDDHFETDSVTVCPSTTTDVDAPPFKRKERNLTQAIHSPSSRALDCLDRVDEDREVYVEID